MARNIPLDLQAAIYILLETNMLNRNAGPTRTFGFLVSVEIEDKILTPEQAAMRLGDAFSFVEGIGEVDVQSLGEVDTVDTTE